MKIEKKHPFPHRVWSGWWCMEWVCVGSGLWRRKRKRSWLAIHFKHLSCVLTAWESILEWKLFLRSWTRRTHSYALAKSKKYSCHQQKSARIGCPAKTKSPTSPGSSPHPCLCMSLCISTLETWPPVRSWPWLAPLHLPFIFSTSGQPLVWKQFTGQLREVMLVYSSGSQVTYFSSKGTLVYNNKRST